MVNKTESSKESKRGCYLMYLAWVDGTLSGGAGEALVQFKVFAQVSCLQGSLTVRVAYQRHLNLVQHSGLQT